MDGPAAEGCRIGLVPTGEPSINPQPSTLNPLGEYYDRFWQPENRAAQEQHDFHAFQRSVDRALGWVLHDGGGLALKVVLEIGPGRGRDTEAFARGGARIIALDLSTKSLELARERLTRAGFADRIFCIVGDAARMPFRDRAFDLTFSRFVVAHVDTDALGPELARVLRPGGRAVMVEPLAGNPLVRLYRCFAATGCRETAPRYVSLGAVRRMAASFPRGWRHREFYLFSVVALALRGTPLFRPISWLLQLLELPFTTWGPFRGLCWVLVAELRR
jgi:SAM-dependent methyltransferase